MTLARQRDCLLGITRIMAGRLRNRGWLPANQLKLWWIAGAEMVAQSYNDAQTPGFYTSELLKTHPANAERCRNYAYIMVQLGHYKEGKREILGALDAAQGFERTLLIDRLCMTQSSSTTKSQERLLLWMRDPMPGVK